MREFPLSRYRRNVAAVIQDPKHAPGKVLLFHRTDTALQGWQFPQGGIESGESPALAVRRELREEASIRRVRILGRTRGWLTYDWPEFILRKNEKFRGQRQIYFLLHLAAPIEEQFQASEDFDSYEWVSPEEAVARAVDFKQGIYRDALAQLLNPAL